MTPRTDKPEQSTKKFRTRLFLFFSSALFLLLFGVSLTIYFALFEQMKRAENESIVHFAEIRSMTITEWCRRAKDLARQITSRTRIRQELEKYNNGQIELDQLTRFTSPKLRDAMNLSDEIAGIVRLDKKNQTVAACWNKVDFKVNQDEVSKYISSDVSLSEPIHSGNSSFIIVSAPITNHVGERQGTDLVIIQLNSLKKIIANSKGIGQTSKIVVGYASSGNSISDLFSFLKEPTSFSKESELHSAVQSCILKAIEGKRGVINTNDTVIAFQPIAECNWGLAICQSRSELYGTVYRKMAIIGGLSIAVYFVILIGFWFLLKPLAGRILLRNDELERMIREKTLVLENEISERKKAEIEKEQVIANLKKAMQEIKTLSGLLPICSNCKKIRDDQGYWSMLESYLGEHSDVQFTHSICPECAKKLYPDLDIEFH